jgi:hypothetical protein
MSVGPSVWGPPSCEGLLCGCCVDVVNLTFSFEATYFIGPQFAKPGGGCLYSLRSYS